MASKIKRIKDKNNQKLVDKFAKTRHELKLIIKNKSLSMKERVQAMLKLDRLPKASSGVKLNNRCAETGNTRGFFRYFGLSRHSLKRCASAGQLPGAYVRGW